METGVEYNKQRLHKVSYFIARETERTVVP
jgi:hypothetical protein